MEHSEQINELAAALSKAQSEMSPAKKDTDNPFFKSKYADLASVWEACRKCLTENNLSVVQLPEQSESGLMLRTILMHQSGQYISSVFNMPLGKCDPQGYGSALTYARRYSLAALVGVYQDDDDANKATEQTKEHAKEPKKDANPNAITDAQIAKILSLCQEYGINNENLLAVLKWKFRVNNGKELTKAQAGLLINNMIGIWEEYAAQAQSAATNEGVE